MLSCERRMFIQPNVFEKSARPIFQSSKRQHGIYFQFPYSEFDDLTMNFRLDTVSKALIHLANLPTRADCDQPYYDVDIQWRKGASLSPAVQLRHKRLFALPHFELLGIENDL